jgi:hypothetical protein
MGRSDTGLGTGITVMSRFNACAISSLTQSSASSKRRCPCPFRALSQLGSDQNRHHLAFGQPLFQDRGKLRDRAHVNVDKDVLSAKGVL